MEKIIEIIDEDKKDDIIKELKKEIIRLEKDYNKYKEDTRKYLKEYDELRYKYNELKYSKLGESYEL